MMKKSELKPNSCVFLGGLKITHEFTTLKCVGLLCFV